MAHLPNGLGSQADLLSQLLDDGLGLAQGQEHVRTSCDPLRQPTATQQVLQVCFLRWRKLRQTAQRSYYVWIHLASNQAIYHTGAVS